MSSDPGRRLVVSTQCPSCGAPLDFSEGSNCVRCEYCESSSLVTGRGRTLAYGVAARVTGRDAFAAARFVEPSDAGAFRVLEPRLHFLPYYRFRAIELRWKRPDPRPRPYVPSPTGDSGDYRPAISIEQAMADLEPGPNDVEMGERHLERNFLALEAPVPELYSLGLRADALKLTLFGRSALTAEGSVVATEIAPDEAIAVAERAATPADIAARALLARRLSVVYFPFWVVPVHRVRATTVTVVDGVTGAIVVRGAPEERFAKFRTASDDEETVGFRPLVCPNCGWSLPVRPDDFVFFCSTCRRAWKVAGKELIEIAHRFVKGEASAHGAPARYLPLWELSGSIDGAGRRFLVPAFRYRRWQRLADLAAASARRAPRVEPAEPVQADVHGAYLDEGDAAALAAFAEIGAGLDRFDDVADRRERRLELGSADLVWAGFASDGYAFRDPFLGLSLPKNLLV